MLEFVYYVSTSQGTNLLALLAFYCTWDPSRHFAIRYCQCLVQCWLLRGCPFLWIYFHTFFSDLHLAWHAHAQWLLALHERMKNVLAKCRESLCWNICTKCNSIARVLKCRHTCPCSMGRDQMTLASRTLLGAKRNLCSSSIKFYSIYLWAALKCRAHRHLALYPTTHHRGNNQSFLLLILYNNTTLTFFLCSAALFFRLRYLTYS